jgi:hypothetical protein
MEGVHKNDTYSTGDTFTELVWKFGVWSGEFRRLMKLRYLLDYRLEHPHKKIFNGTHMTELTRLRIYLQ